MRLSEDRVLFIAKQLAKRLRERQLIETGLSEASLGSVLARAIIADLIVEDEIDEEAKEYISRLGRPIPPSSAEWDAIFRQKKEELARRRNYVY
ncbi:MAG: DUF507 family protein [bacterium]